MATHVTLQFNDGEINLSTSSFLFKQSKLLQSIDIDEDNTIPILCSRSYILDENNICLFDDKYDLLFMFTLLPNKFIEVCKFLDIICYENNDTLFNTQFITYVMTNLKEEINAVLYFMQNEIRSIMNYINNACIDLQIKSCTPAFYALYLTEYKEEIIKHNRIDIYELSTDKTEYYRYIHKYENHLTFIVKETQEYKDYITNISNKLLYLCYISNNVNDIKELIKQGADVNFLNKNFDNSALQFACVICNNLEVIKCLVENGADVNFKCKSNYTALYVALLYQFNTLEVIKFLVEHGAIVTLNSTDPCYAYYMKNNKEVLDYLMANNAIY